MDPPTRNRTRDFSVAILSITAERHNQLDHQGDLVSARYGLKIHVYAYFKRRKLRGSKVYQGPYVLFEHQLNYTARHIH